MPCAPVNENVPPLPPIPGPFGIPVSPFGISLSLPAGMPEDLLDLLKNFSFPSMPVLGALDGNFEKDILDLVFKMLNYIYPLLAAYQVILPILRMIVCIIEVICSLLNPFALIGAVVNLFTVCLPGLLSLFPILWIIILILTIIYLIILLIEYIIAKIIQFILLIIANIEALALAFSISDEIGIVAILAKLGAVLCSLNGLLVVLLVVDAIIAIIRAILQLVFSIPPCGDDSNCCQPQICPAWVKNNNSISASTGVLQYVSEIDLIPVAGAITGLPPGFNLTQVERGESWQFYDPFATQFTQMQNINVAYDLPDGYTPTVLFPTSQTFSATTPPMQAAYTVDLTFLYDPTQFNRIDNKGKRDITIKGCIVLTDPDGYYLDFANNQVIEPTGVADLAGGLAYEKDGKTPLMIAGQQGTLNTVIHLPTTTSTTTPTLTPAGTLTFSKISYNFNINHPILLQNGLITLGCIPQVATAKTFVNNTFGNTANFARVNTLINSPNFPSPAAAQACLSSAIDALRNNVNLDQVAEFQSTTTACLNILQNNAIAAANELINIGFDPYTSTFTLTPDVQFSTLNINVQVLLKDTNGQLLTAGMPATMGPTIASGIQPTITFGTISEFVYDGYQFFNAQISSNSAGAGTIEVAYQNQTISTVNIATTTITPTITPYAFIYAPLPVKTGVGDTDGQPRLGVGDIGGG